MSVACFLLLTIWLSVLKWQGAANWRRYTFYFTKRGNKGRVEINRDVSFTDTVLWFQIWFFCNYCFLLWLMLLLFWATRYLRNSWYRSMLLNSQFFQRFDLPMQGNPRPSWILDSTPWILDSRYWILCHWNLDSGSQSFAGFRISWAVDLDPKAQDSRFHK